MSNLRLILFALGIVFLLQGCSFLYGDPEPKGRDPVTDVSGVEEPWEVADISAVNQDGEDWNVDQMEGQWWLTKTIFTRCPTVCMTMTPNMVALQDGILENNLDVQIVSFTVDPDFDSPEQLLEYADAYEAELSNWQFVTGYSQDEIEDFALKTFKLPVTRIPDQNDIAHPTRFFLVNPEGIIVRMYDGDADFDLDASIADLIDVVN
ncbi:MULTISPECIES: SCO family protein [Bacillaceae]|uniref:SCO family protein n=1 Tax=Evansella alkalicola TaxID=745819 RepID=A0ABS6JTT3_9BACI|nr:MULTISPECIES: SCO family protein [Bacillaceae]MBU9721825.1 SCO family protein [Bacillus alkalicola]